MEYKLKNEWKKIFKCQLFSQFTLFSSTSLCQSEATLNLQRNQTKMATSSIATVTPTSRNDLHAKHCASTISHGQNLSAFADHSNFPLPWLSEIWKVPRVLFKNGHIGSHFDCITKLFVSTSSRRVFPQLFRAFTKKMFSISFRKYPKENNEHRRKLCCYRVIEKRFLTNHRAYFPWAIF